MKDHKKSLEELFQLALTFEAAEKELLKWANAISASDGTTVGATRYGRNFKQRSGLQGRKKTTHQMSSTNSSHLCASCGSNHLRSNYKFINAKCHSCGKLGHIDKVCRATTGVTQSNTQLPDSAVVPLSSPQQENHIPPMFQTLQLTDFERQL